MDYTRGEEEEVAEEAEEEERAEARQVFFLKKNAMIQDKSSLRKIYKKGYRTYKHASRAYLIALFF